MNAVDASISLPRGLLEIHRVCSMPSSATKRPNHPNPAISACRSTYVKLMSCVDKCVVIHINILSVYIFTPYPGLATCILRAAIRLEKVCSNTRVDDETVLFLD